MDDDSDEVFNFEAEAVKKGLQRGSEQRRNEYISEAERLGAQFGEALGLELGFYSEFLTCFEQRVVEREKIIKAQEIITAVKNGDKFDQNRIKVLRVLMSSLMVQFEGVSKVFSEKIKQVQFNQDVETNW